MESNIEADQYSSGFTAIFSALVTYKNILIGTYKKNLLLIIYNRADCQFLFSHGTQLLAPNDYK